MQIRGRNLLRLHPHWDKAEWLLLSKPRLAKASVFPGVVLRFYPFSPLLVTPWTKYFCNGRNSSTGTSAEMEEAA